MDSLVILIVGFIAFCMVIYIPIGISSLGSQLRELIKVNRSINDTLVEINLKMKE